MWEVLQREGQVMKMSPMVLWCCQKRQWGRSARFKGSTINERKKSLMETLQLVFCCCVVQKKISWSVAQSRTWKIYHQQLFLKRTLKDLTQRHDGSVIFLSATGAANHIFPQNHCVMCFSFILLITALWCIFFHQCSKPTQQGGCLASHTD